ncbi:hypothetical protein DH2020_030661 [Rehmannia glutinosa]|uniref:Aluminum-activated malate transporter 12-like n=1 Tax=Rehmannia glutinosa TaxID=99300 RepID=A0ABR0VK96_REHGL
MYSGIAMGIAAEDPYDWTAKMDAMKKRSFVLVEKMKTFAKSVWMTISRVGQEDPCRVLHSLKVGFSLTLVSLLYLLEPLFKGIGQNAIWAVMTVVVVLEFTAGATLCKGLNRGIGTLLAGSLAFLIQYIAQESGQIFRAIFIGTTVFVIGTAATYMRFIPYIKKNYDYGVVIFLLTFNLITVSSYRIHNVLKIAQERFYMIAIGCGICLLMSLIVFPNWSGQDLHNSTVSKLEGLANSIEACVNEYFSNEHPNVAKDKLSEDPIYKGYKAVLDSKSTDETLAMHASWEPCHSRNCDRVPWQQYVKLGAVLRHFGYTVVALHGCLQTEIQQQQPGTTPHRKILLSESLCRSVKTDSSALLQWKKSKRANEQAKEMAERKVLRPTLSKIAITSLDFSEALPFAAFASLLVEAVARLDLVIDEVEELGRVASFKEFSPGDDRQKTERGNDAPLAMENHLPSHGDD